jgi:hypothetical protein
VVQSAKQLAAERKNLAKARAAKKGKPLTAKARAADVANLAKARQKLKAEGKSWHKSSLSTHRGAAHHRMYAKKAQPESLGDHRLANDLYHKQSKPKKITGINPRFKKRLSSTSYDQRSGWKSARTHHFKKRLHARKPKVMHVKNWRHRKGRLTPR